MKPRQNSPNIRNSSYYLGTVPSPRTVIERAETLRKCMHATSRNSRANGLRTGENLRVDSASCCCEHANGEASGDAIRAQGLCQRQWFYSHDQEDASAADD